MIIVGDLGELYPEISQDDLMPPSLFGQSSGARAGSWLVRESYIKTWESFWEKGSRTFVFSWHWSQSRLGVPGDSGAIVASVKQGCGKHVPPAVGVSMVDSSPGGRDPSIPNSVSVLRPLMMNYE